jgi:VanZ family protein
MIVSFLSGTWFFGMWVFFALACCASWLSAKGVAKSWKPMAAYAFNALFLAAAVRFLHFALYGGTMFSLTDYIPDLIVLAIVGIVGYRFTRTNQMTAQYPWLYEKASPLSWKDRG